MPPSHGFSAFASQTALSQGHYLTSDQAVQLRPFLSRLVLQHLSADLRRPTPFEGDRLQGTALVVDVSGFTKLEITLNAKAMPPFFLHCCTFRLSTDNVQLTATT